MNRQHMLNQLGQVHEWDIIIIGGGATGLGAAVDAASRGYKTLLVEQYDFAKGTSGRSTKLVHGGVRYLAQGNIKLVMESLRERGLLLQNAPHVCHDMPFILPFYSRTGKWYYGIGLKCYDLLSGKLSLGKTSFLSRKKTLELLPGIAAEKLSGAVLYHDGQFDDSRLAITLAQTAAEQGATVLNYCRLSSLVKTGGNISGVIIDDMINNRQHTAKCKTVINATGVFTDEVMKLDDKDHENMISPSQGVHIVIEKKFFPGENALIIPETDDGRVLFAVPWHGKVIVGTTDTALEKISIEPTALPEEVDFIIRHFNRYMSAVVTRNDIKAVFAGLRPLITVKGKKKTAFLSRDHTTIVSPGGMVTITGGKWTTYRTMGKSAVESAARVARLEKLPCTTASLKLHGYSTAAGLNGHLSVYGSDIDFINRLAEADSSLKEKIHPLLPYLKAEIVWAVRNEMALTVEDILSRRTRALILDAKAAIEAAPAVASIMAKEMNMSSDWEILQVKIFEKLAKQYIID